MRCEMVLLMNGYKQVLQIIAETFKNWKVWKVIFPDGQEAVLFKVGNIWMQRNEDALDRSLLDTIGEWIDRFNLGAAIA